ncbi:MAG: adenosylmethionine--8-amino-7-oxononanoate transaminase [Candidatus Brocadiia bacterium]
MNKTNRRLSGLDKKYLWHPFTQMKEWMSDDMVIISRAKGNYLYDSRGRRYLDGVSSLWCNVHGHGRPEIDRAVRGQLNRVAHSTMLGLANVPAIELARELIRVAPKGLSRVFYSDSGSTAVEIALKMAFQFWQQAPGNRKANTRKTKFLTFANAYHGDTIGSVSLGGMDLFHAIYKPLLFKTIQAPAPYCYRCPLNMERSACRMECLLKAEQLIKKHHRQLAGIVIEPLIQGAAGMITQPAGFLKRLRQLCTQYNILFIVDEVATGFGRTGRMFACEHESVRPDIMAVAKGITGGYLPLAATLTTEKVFAAFLGEYRDNKTFFHGHTYTGNPLACAAALANLEIFRKDKTIRQLGPKIRRLTERLNEFRRLAHVGDIRQCGLMVGIELVRDKAAKQPYPYQARMGRRVMLNVRQHGIILRPLGDVIVLMPPLSISGRQLEYLLDAVWRAIEEIR